MSAMTQEITELTLEPIRRQRQLLEASVFRAPPEPRWTTPNSVLLDHPAYRLRLFEPEAEVMIRDRRPVLVVPPEVNRSHIVDFREGQSLVATLINSGFPRVATLDWKTATAATARRDIDDSVLSILESLGNLGGEAHVIGLCQGGWESAIAAALEPDLVASLTLVASPIDFAAGEGMIRHLAQIMPMTAYRALVNLGGGVMTGRLISFGFDALMPWQRFGLKYLTLWNNLDDEVWMERYQHLDDWYRDHKDLPGPLYLRAVRELFKENRLVQGRFTCLGRKVDLSRIACPLCLVVGDRDHITPPPQIWAAQRFMSSTEVLRVETPGGHIGAFMGSEELREHWPKIIGWLQARGEPAQ
jgi:poly(3-hydroxyalkanoate) synthetase